MRLECTYSRLREEILTSLYTEWKLLDIETYPPDKVIRPLNDWGQGQLSSRLLHNISCQNCIVVCAYIAHMFCVSTSKSKSEFQINKILMR